MKIRSYLLVVLLSTLSNYAQVVDDNDSIQNRIVSKKIDSIFHLINNDPFKIDNYIEVSYYDETYLKEYAHINFDIHDYFIKEFIYKKVDSLKLTNPKSPIPYIVKSKLAIYKIDELEELKKAYELDSTYNLTNELLSDFYLKKFKENELIKDSVLIYQPLIEKHIHKIDFNNIGFSNLTRYYSWYYFTQNQDRIKQLSKQIQTFFNDVNYDWNYYFFPDDNQLEKYFNDQLNQISYSLGEVNEGGKTQFQKNFNLIDYFFNENLNHLKWMNDQKALFGFTNIKEPNIIFYWKRSFHNPIMFQLVDKISYAQLTFIEGEVDEKGNVDYKKNMPIIKKISQNNWMELVDKIDNIGNKYIIAQNYGFDGSLWNLEYYDTNQQLSLSLWSPKTNCNSNDDYCILVQVCLEIMKASELRIISDSKIKFEDSFKERYILY